MRDERDEWIEERYEEEWHEDTFDRAERMFRREELCASCREDLLE